MSRQTKAEIEAVLSEVITAHEQSKADLKAATAQIKRLKADLRATQTEAARKHELQKPVEKVRFVERPVEKIKIVEKPVEKIKVVEKTTVVEKPVERVVRKGRIEDETEIARLNAVIDRMEREANAK